MLSDKGRLGFIRAFYTLYTHGTAHAPAWFGALRFDKTPGTQHFVTGTTKIINADVATAGAVELQGEGAFRAARQHASALTELEVLFRQTAFVADVWKNWHVSLISSYKSPRLGRWVLIGKTLYLFVQLLVQTTNRADYKYIKETNMNRRGSIIKNS